MKKGIVAIVVIWILILSACPNFDLPECGGSGGDDPGGSVEVSYLFPFYVGARWQYRVTARFNSDPEEVGIIELTVTSVDATVPSATISVTGRLSGYPGGYSFPVLVYIRQIGTDTLERRTGTATDWQKTLAPESWTGGEYVLMSRTATNRIEPSTSSVARR